MLPVTIRRVLFANHRVDFRKGFDGLLAEAYRIGAQPYDGDCVDFLKKDRTQLRSLVGDRCHLKIQPHLTHNAASFSLALLGRLERVADAREQ